jgi:hypothetical protein
MPFACMAVPIADIGNNIFVSLASRSNQPEFRKSQLPLTEKDILWQPIAGLNWNCLGFAARVLGTGVPQHKPQVHRKQELNQRSPSTTWI